MSSLEMAGAGPTIEITTVTLCDITGYTVEPLHKGHVRPRNSYFVYWGESVHSELSSLFRDDNLLLLLEGLSLVS